MADNKKERGAKREGKEGKGIKGLAPETTVTTRRHGSVYSS
jgi:hypothetical protein